MIHFCHRPDPVFLQILNQLFDEADNECLAAMSNRKKNLHLLDPSLIKLFGGPETLREILSRFRRAHDALEVYMVSDYFFLVLDRMLKRWVARYNRQVKRKSIRPFKLPNRRLLTRIDFQALFDSYFWDTDFDTPYLTATALARLPYHQGGILDYSKDALNASRWIPPKTSDLWIEKREPREDWYEESDWHMSDAQVRRMLKRELKEPDN